MGKSAGKAPDPVATANAQAAANVEAARATAMLNNPDSYGPGGQVLHGWRPDGTSTVDVRLSPEQQKIYNNQTDLGIVSSQAALDASNRMAGYLGTPLDTSALPAAGQGVNTSTLPGLVQSVGGAGQGLTSSAGANQGMRTDFSTGAPLDRLAGAGQGIQSNIGGAGRGVGTNFDPGAALARVGTKDYSADRDAVSNALLSRLQPQDDRDRAALEARLSAQGFTPGSQGYKDAADELNRRATDERMQAVLAGGTEQSRLAGLELSQAGFNNAASTTETNQRNLALQDANAAQGQIFGQRATDATFRNAAQAQGFGQRATQTGANNQAATTEQASWNSGLAAINEAQAQGYTQRYQDATLGNAAQGQAFDQGVQTAGFQNTARTQALNEAMGVSDQATKQRQQALAEMLQLRAQPINEVSALFGLGNGVQMPQQAPFTGSQVAAPDYQGLVQNQYNAKSQAAASGNATAASAATAVAAAAAIAI